MDTNLNYFHPTLWNMFHQQINSFKIYLSFGLILRSRTTNELRYFHSSQDVSGKILDMPHLINTHA